MSRHDHRQFAEAAAEATRERDWLIPSALMTAGLGAAAVLLMPVAGYDHVPPYFSRFVGWLNYSMVGGIFLALVHLIRLRKAGVESPVEHMKAQFKAKKGAALAAVAGMMLAGIDMLFFMWIKPEVTAVSPFWADEMLADADRAIFGRDPWRFFEGVDLSFHAWAYSFFWAVAIMATLVWLFARKPSAERSSALLSYFAVWSIFGPLGQLALSSAGPIFYARAGEGSRFDELAANIPDITQKISRYLWSMHVNGDPGVGAGISAMPSLHIATVSWIVLAFAGAKSRLTPLTVVFALYIWAMSVALGWHYAVDGIAGALGAIACHAAARRYMKSRARTAVPVGEPLPLMR
jgi:hypothetical protein